MQSSSVRVCDGAATSATTLLQAGALSVNFKSPFTWRSGIQSPFYMDCRVVNHQPSHRRVLIQALANAVAQEFPQATLVVGIAEAGVVWSSCVAHEINLPHCFVRKSLKSYGPHKNRYVEVAPRDPIKAVLVDDLICTGESIGQAIQRISAESSIQVCGVLSIVNWGFLRARQAIEAQIPTACLVSHPELMNAALSEGLVTEAQRQSVKEFMADPWRQAWAHAA